MFTPFNANVSSIAKWHAEPTTRGTFSILSSCLLTLFLCSYTALHLNISTSHKSRRWTRLRWFVLALLAPEIVALVAWLQLDLARTLARKATAASDQLNRQMPQTEGLAPSKVLEQPHTAGSGQKWGTVHGFYIVMGGYYTIDRTTGIRKTVTPKGAKYLLHYRPELFPFVEEQAIRDMGKSDQVAKTLACLQALWFCVQVINRLATGLDTSLLELNTFAHCLYAMGIYGLWWNKPQDLNGGTEIDAVAAGLLGMSQVIQRARMEAELATRLSDPEVERSISRAQSILLHPSDIPNFPGQKPLEERRDLDIVLWLSITGAVYGGIHLLAWNGSFNSYAQQILWRVSGICISVFCPLIAVLVSPMTRMAEVNSRRKTFCGLLFIMGPATILYIISRSFLVIEPFIMLPYVSESTLRVSDVAQSFSLFG